MDDAQALVIVAIMNLPDRHSSSARLRAAINCLCVLCKYVNEQKAQLRMQLQSSHFGSVILSIAGVICDYRKALNNLPHRQEKIELEYVVSALEKEVTRLMTDCIDLLADSQVMTNTAMWNHAIRFVNEWGEVLRFENLFLFDNDDARTIRNRCADVLKILAQTYAQADSLPSCAVEAAQAAGFVWSQAWGDAQEGRQIISQISSDYPDNQNMFALAHLFVYGTYPEEA